MTTASFDFMTDDGLLASLSADRKELEICFKNEAWKSAQILAGSIVEAVLLDYLCSSGYSKSDPLKMQLANMIDVCKAEGILTSKTADLCGVIRQYRNLIHPGLCLRIQETADSDSAQVARALVNVVTREIATIRKAKYGYTASQIVAKVEGDPLAVQILPELLKGTHSYEIEKLLLDVLPNRYLELCFEPEAEIAERMKFCFQRTFEIAAEESQRKVAARFAKVVKEEIGENINAYVGAFFRSDYLKYYSEADSSIVKKHIFARLTTNQTAQNLTLLSGIEHFVGEDDLLPFSNALVSIIILSEDPKIAADARDYLKLAFKSFPPEFQSLLIETLNGLASKLGEKNYSQLRLDVLELHDQLVKLNTYDKAIDALSGLSVVAELKN